MYCRNTANGTLRSPVSQSTYYLGMHGRTLLISPMSFPSRGTKGRWLLARIADCRVNNSTSSSPFSSNLQIRGYSSGSTQTLLKMEKHTLEVSPVCDRHWTRQADLVHRARSCGMFWNWSALDRFWKTRCPHLQIFNGIYSCRVRHHIKRYRSERSTLTYC